MKYEYEVRTTHLDTSERRANASHDDPMARNHYLAKNLTAWSEDDLEFVSFVLAPEDTSKPFVVLLRRAV